MKAEIFRPKIYVLVGLPGSGKSTWINSFLKTTNDDYVIISSDNIIEKYASSEGKTYSEVYNKYIKLATTEMNMAALAAIKEGKNIIWDQTNITSNKRKGILSRLPKNYEKIAVVFEVSDDVLYKSLEARFKETGKNIPRQVIEEMKKNYVRPTMDEGFNSIIEIKR